MNSPTLVLLSGGLDSAANLAFAFEEGRTLAALHINYGQRAELSERRASEKLAEYYGADFHALDLPWLGALGGSSLTDLASAVPELEHDQLDDLNVIRGSAKSVWVPNRNGVFIQVAAALAERRGLASVLVGFNVEEAATFPDNTEDFLRRSTAALALSTRNGVVVECYTTALTKTEMVAKLRQLRRQPFPFADVWSCYHSGELICGHCESCQRYLRATQGN